MRIQNIPRHSDDELAYGHRAITVAIEEADQPFCIRVPLKLEQIAELIDIDLSGTIFIGGFEHLLHLGQLLVAFHKLQKFIYVTATPTIGDYLLLLHVTENGAKEGTEETRERKVSVKQKLCVAFQLAVAADRSARP